MNAWGCLASSPHRRGRDVRSRFPPLQRAQIVALACLEPVAEGLHITHWTSKDLARQAVADGIVPTISARTIRRILRDVDLQPHRTRYWRTAHLDAQFKRRAEKVLWCYANADGLAKKGYGVVCADEIPNHQVLERRPIRRAIPGSIEHQEFEYIRHGTVNLLNFLFVHSGRMEAQCVETKDAAHYVAELKRFRRRHRHLRGVYLIHDGDPSHTATLTRKYLESCKGWWRPRFTPAHASWLDQAEILNNVFEHRYLKRGSWATRQAFIDHVTASWPEYNELYAHPFEWTWTNKKMRRWFAEQAR
jgi:transposase-like protein